MTAFLLSYSLLMPSAEPPAPPARAPKPISAERIKELVKKLEEPTRHDSDPKQGPPEDGVSPTFGFRWHSAALGELKQAGEAALPAVYALLADAKKPGQARAHAAVIVINRLKGKGAKQELDRQALKALQEALRDKDLSLKWGVLRIAAQYGAAGAWVRFSIMVKSVPTLDRDTLHFSDAAMDGLLPDVIALVSHEEPEVAATAATVLFEFGRPKQGIKELLRALDRRERFIRARVVAALSRVGVDDPDALKAVLGQLKPEHYGDTYETVVQSVGRFGPKAKDAVPALIDVLKSSDWKPAETTYLYDTAINSLGEIGPGAKAAIPWLLKYMECCPSSLGQWEGLIAALDRIDPEAGKQGRVIFKRKMDELKKQPN